MRGTIEEAFERANEYDRNFIVMRNKVLQVFVLKIRDLKLKNLWPSCNLLPNAPLIPVKFEMLYYHSAVH